MFTEVNSLEETASMLEACLSMLETCSNIIHVANHLFERVRCSGITVLTLFE